MIVPRSVFRSLIGLILLGFVKAGGAPAAAETVIAAVGEDGVQRLEILVDSNFFKPDRFTVKQNIPVELTFKSAAVIVPHDFVLKSPQAGLNIETEIGPRETAVVRFTPTRIGEFEFSCTKKLLFFPSHKELGMVGTMVVER